MHRDLPAGLRWTTAHSLLLAVLPGVWACGETITTTDPSPSSNVTGSVTVTVATTGADLPSTYGVTIGGLSGTVPANGSVTIAAVPAGSAAVQLTGVAANCAVTGSTSQTVTVAADTDSPVSFAVVCVAADANALIAQAIASMETALFAAVNIDVVADLDGLSFAESNSLFNQALAVSPSNDTASFGAAVTGIFLLEDNTDLRALIDDWDEYFDDAPIAPPIIPLILVGPAVAAVREPLTLPLGFSTETLEELAFSGKLAVALTTGPMTTHVAPPSIGQLQAVLREVVRPVMLEALDHLLDITNTAFVFTITEAMQGEAPIDADPLELDFTEILALQAGVNLVVAAIDVGTAYTFTPNPLTSQGLVDALTPGSDFLKLSTGGADLLADALDRLLAAGPILLAGLDALEAETDDQTDDIIKYDPLGLGEGLTTEQIADARAVIQDVTDALSGPTSVTLDEGSVDEFTFTLDAGEFFTDPISDFKALLPDYDVFTTDEAGETGWAFRWTALNLPDWTFPDPTVSGILPGMTTTAELLTFPGIVDEGFFDWRLTGGGYSLITIDGKDCLADVEAGGSGCAVGSDFFWSGYVDIGDGAWFTADGVLGGGGYFFAGWIGDAPAVVDNLDGTYTMTMDLELDDGSGTLLSLTSTFVDRPGFTSLDPQFRRRGGSTIEFTYLGSDWVFEWQNR